jgi:hypothetical protein
MWVRSNLDISALMQYERWLFPAIQPNTARNVTAALQLSLQPNRLFGHSQASGSPTNQP